MSIANNGMLTISNLMDTIETVKYSPTSVARAILEHVDTVSDGEVNLVDLTNPAMMLLSAGAAMFASSNNEVSMATRAIYPSLAQTAKQLYRHMTDKEFVNVFAVPGSTQFTVIMNRDDVLSKMVYDAEAGAHKAIFPRDTFFRALDTVYTLDYPIVIQLSDNGTFKIEYDVSIQSPVATLKTNVITPRVSRDKDGNGWIAFTIDVRQFDIESTVHTLEKSIPLKKEVAFPNMYYMSRVFYRNSETAGWKEMKVTHGDYVYDATDPTAMLDVVDGTVTLEIPHIYVMSNQISGEIRHDVYTTKGALAENYSNLGLESFSVSTRAIDEERDLPIYVTSLSDISHRAIAPGIATGGRNSLTFLQLRDRVIDNTTGSIDIPITNIQMSAKVQDAGFDLVRNVDVITNRIFLATRKLPKPSNEKLAASANIGINTFSPSLQDLDLSAFVFSNGDRRTIDPKALYVNENGIVRLLSGSEVFALKTMSYIDLVAEINSKQYLYSPYHYVLDETGDKFDVRVYDLHACSLSDLNFKEQNQTMNMTVNTGAYQIVKTDTGYQLYFTTISGAYYKNAEQLGMVQCQVGFYPDGEASLATINASFSAYQGEEIVWTVDLLSNMEIDEKNRLKITNAVFSGASTIDVWINLSSEIHVFHTSNSVALDYKPSVADTLINLSTLPENTKAITHEILSLYLGVSLDTLWKRCRALPTGVNYAKYAADVPLLYEQDTYEINPDSGTEIFIEGGNPVRHQIGVAGEQVMDANGDPVFKHLAGETVLDANGDPVVADGSTSVRELDMLFIDGRNYFVTDEANVAYRTELIEVLTTWITENIADLQDVALEKTKIFFYPKTTLGNVKVYTEDSGSTTLPSEQSLKVDLYVYDRVYDDAELRQDISNRTIKILDEYIARTTVNTTEIMEALRASYDDTVVSLNVSGLGGEANYRVLVLAAEENRMCLKKALSLQQDNTLIIGEDVQISFFRVRSA